MFIDYSFFYFFIFLVALVLRCCAQAFLQLQLAEATLQSGAWASHCSGFSCYRVQAVGTLVQQLQHTGSAVVSHRLNCSAACGIFPGNLPVFPALAGEFLSTEPPGKFLQFPFISIFILPLFSPPRFSFLLALNICSFTPYSFFPLHL